MDESVSRVHASEKRWPGEFAALRKLCLGSGLHESLKWGQACYDLDGGNVVLIHGFKDYCALLFMKGALLEDPDGRLVQQTRNVQSARQLRFATVAEIRRRQAEIRGFIEAAIAVERSGARVAMKSVRQFEVPEEFRRRLSADARLASAFAALTPGRQKAYLLHFGGAKRPETREARIEACVPRIRKGLGMRD